jgi:PKD repeat protein
LVRFEGSIRPGTGSHQIRYTWDFGDGETLDGQVVYHSYSGDGTYDVRLEVISSPCPIVKTLAVIETITVGSGVPNIYLPLITKGDGSTSSAGQ